MEEESFVDFLGKRSSSDGRVQYGRCDLPGACCAYSNVGSQCGIPHAILKVEICILAPHASHVLRPSTRTATPGSQNSTAHPPPRLGTTRMLQGKAAVHWKQPIAQQAARGCEHERDQVRTLSQLQQQLAAQCGQCGHMLMRMLSLNRHAGKSRNCHFSMVPARPISRNGAKRSPPAWHGSTSCDQVGLWNGSNMHPLMHLGVVPHVGAFAVGW